jgi:putative ABC transport system substrate-binding protein
MIRRREFITFLGGAAVVWPVAAKAQQRPTMPTIAYLSSRSTDSDASMLVALRRGLAEEGYVEGRNLVIEYRFADGQYDRISALVTEHVPAQCLVGILCRCCVMQSKRR